MYSVFQDVRSQECFHVSHNSIEYADFINMTHSGHLRELHKDTRRNCLEYIEQMECDQLAY